LKIPRFQRCSSLPTYEDEEIESGREKEDFSYISRKRKGSLERAVEVNHTETGSVISQEIIDFMPNLRNLAAHSNQVEK